MKGKLKNALTAALFVALALLQPLGASADSPDFRYRPILAGKALLTEPGFVVRREFDRHGRVVRVEYAKDEVETFSYDRWGRLSAHTRGKSKETYRYDFV